MIGRTVTWTYSLISFQGHLSSAYVTQVIVDLLRRVSRAKSLIAGSNQEELYTVCGSHYFRHTPQFKVCETGRTYFGCDFLGRLYP